MNKFILLEDYIEGVLPDGETNILLKKGDIIEGKISERGYPEGRKVFVIKIGIWCMPTVSGCEIRSIDNEYIESKEGKVFILIEKFKKL